MILGGRDLSLVTFPEGCAIGCEQQPGALSLVLSSPSLKSEAVNQMKTRLIGTEKAVSHPSLDLFP